MADDSLRDVAIASLKRKAAFRRTLWTFVALWVLFILIWLVTGQGYFWPIWPILGMGIGLIVIGYEAYKGPKSSEPNEQQINDEMKKLGGS